MQALQGQMRKCEERLRMLEDNQSAGRDAVNSFADRLVTENASLDARLLELQAATGSHLKSLRRHSTVAIRPWRSCGLPVKQQWLQQPTPWRVPLAQRRVQEGTQT